MTTRQATMAKSTQEPTTTTRTTNVPEGSSSNRADQTNTARQPCGFALQRFLQQTPREDVWNMLDKGTWAANESLHWQSPDLGAQDEAHAKEDIIPSNDGLHVSTGS